MKRHCSLLLVILTSFLAVTPIAAETYSENFDSSTSLPEGWGFIGGTFYGFDTGSTYYMNSDTDYSRSKKNSLCCPVNLPEQFVVSPKMTGQVSFYVRAYRSKRDCALHVYRCSDDGETVGEEITAAARSWSRSNTNTFNLGAEGTRLAFNMYNVYIDDFSGDIFQEGEEIRGLSVLSVESLLDTDELLGDEENHVTLSFMATLKNVGTVDLTPAEENFTVSLLNADGYALLTQPITEAIAAGQTKEVTITRSLEANSLITGKDVRFAVREDFTKTMQYCPTTFAITAYLPQLKVYDSDPTQGYPSELTAHNIINFGNVCKPLSGTYYVRNAGNAPLVIPSITVPQGFSVAPTSLSVEPGQTASFTITLEVSEGDYGLHEGNVILHPDRIDEFYLSVKGITRSPEAVYIDFNDQQFPMGWTVGSGWRISGNYSGTNYYAEQYQYPVVAPSAFISPRLVVEEGETLQFQARAYDTEEWYSAGIVLSYSADLSRWTTVATLNDKLTEDFLLFEISEIPAGQWYIRFQAINAAIDDIWGFRVSTDAPQLAVLDADPSAGTATRLTSGSSLDFGSVGQDTSRTFYIQNVGTGTLDVRSITVPEGFSVSPSTLQLASGASAPVTLTLLVGSENFGSKSGIVRIEALGLETFELNVSGVTRDPSCFFVDFEEGVFPGGWLVGEGWQVTSSYGHEGLMADNHGHDASALITPLLVVADGESLQVDAKCFGQRDWYPPTLKVSYSADRMNWDSIADWTDQLDLSFTRFTLKEIPAGRWYIRFDGANVELDNLEGYRLADAAEHDVALAGVELPEEASVNNLFKATVQLTNLGAVVEHVTATLLVDGQTRATTGQVAIEAGETQTLALSFMPHETTGEVPVVVNIRTESGLAMHSDTLLLAIQPESESSLTKKFTGQVVDDAGQPIAGASLSLISEDDVRYSGQSAANGSFHITVHQSGKSYALTIARDGYAPVEGRLDFNYSDIADTTFVLRYLGIRLFADSIPVALDLDSDYVASVCISSGRSLTAEEYELTLHIGDQSFAAEGTDIAAADSMVFQVPFVPQAEGTLQAYFQLTLTDGTILTTQPVDVTVTRPVIDAILSIPNGTTAPAYNLRGQRVPAHHLSKQKGVIVISRRKVLVR